MKCASEDIIQSTKAEAEVNLIVTECMPDAISLEDVNKATSLDEELQKIKLAVETGKMNELYNDPKMTRYTKVMNEFSVVDGIVLKGRKIVIPKSLQKRIVKLGHEGHQGTVRCKQYLRSRVWFSGLDKAIDEEVKGCIPCQAATSAKHREPLVMTELPDKAWQKLSIDFCGPFPCGTYCFVVVDDYSRYPVVEFLTSTSASATIPKLDKIFSLFGIPEEIKSDNGPPFQGEEFKEYAKSVGFRHRKITPLHPEANGQAERFVRTLKKAVDTFVAEGKNWKREIHNFLRVYRSTPHATTGRSPFELIFGRPMDTKLPKVSGELHLEKDVQLRVRDKTAKKKEKKYADTRRRTKLRKFMMGETVLVRQEKRNKLSTPFEPIPYHVTRVKGSMITAQRTTDNRTVTRNSSFFKSIPPVPKIQPTVADDVVRESTEQSLPDPQTRHGPLQEQENVPPSETVVGERMEQDHLAAPTSNTNHTRFPTRNRKKPEYYGINNT